MLRNYLSFWLFGIALCLVSCTEAIVGGERAEADQFPYQVSILYHGEGHRCAGGLVTVQYVISAARCVIKPDGSFETRRLYIFAGSNDLHHTSAPAQTVEVKRISVSADYNSEIDGSVGDIAILKLKQPLQPSRHIRTLKLPRNRFEDYDYEEAQIAGWGWDRIRVENGTESGHRTDTRLRYANADLLNYQACQHSYPSVTISPKHVCARVKQRGIVSVNGVCNGDGGSPLVMDGTVIGIFSRSPFGCAERGSASLYTRASHYLAFIHDAIRDRITNDMRVRIR